MLRCACWPRPSNRASCSELTALCLLPRAYCVDTIASSNQLRVRVSIEIWIWSDRACYLPAGKANSRHTPGRPLVIVLNHRAVRVVKSQQFDTTLCGSGHEFEFANSVHHAVANPGCRFFQDHRQATADRWEENRLQKFKRCIALLRQSVMKSPYKEQQILPLFRTFENLEKL